MAYLFYAADDRSDRLCAAHEQGMALLAAVEAAGLVRPGISEADLSRDIHQLARRDFGVRRHWHKRIVRAGPNTLFPYADDPADRVIGTDDILFLDLGPVFDGWEADIGRTYVLGNDPAKLRLREAVVAAWKEGQAFFRDNEGQVSGAELFAHTRELAARYGYRYGGPHAGHLIGNFPHEAFQGADPANYIWPDNQAAMTAPDADGRPRSWIYEIHFVDDAIGLGAFCEQWLGAPPPVQKGSQ